MSHRRTVSSVLAAGGLAAIGAVLPISPAAAATPQCTTAQIQIPPSHGGIEVPSDWNGNTRCWMARGNYSDGVRAMQHALRVCYGQGIAEDSDYGPRTESALSRVQGMIGAAQDGGYGPETASKMKFAVIGSNDPSTCLRKLW
jgi:hypothetical protein